MVLPVHGMREALRAPAHVTILGAGLMGRLLALALVRAGYAVSMHEAGDADGTPAGNASAAHVAAAMLAPLAESAIAPANIVRMGQYSLARWPQWLAQMDAPVFFQQNGTLLLWHRQDAAEAQRLLHTLRSNQAAHPELPALQMLNAQALQTCEPGLPPRFAAGAHLPGEGQLDNRQLLAALHATLIRAGVQWHWRQPRDIAGFSPDDWLLDCRGLGARGQWQQLRGVRGEVLRVHAPEVRLARPARLVHPRYPIYIAPKPDNLFVIGATEIETDDASPVSVRSALELLSAAYSVHPGFAEARILEMSARCRPALTDNLPALRWRGARVLQINGLYRHGFLIAPALCDVVLQLLHDGKSALAQRFELAVQ